MLNIIICDDNVKDANKVERIVKKHFKGLNYTIFMSYDFDKNFMKIADSPLENKIYLLDIETPSRSGIDVARHIRKNDYNSVIIFLSAHDDLSRIVAKKNLMVLNFINKFDSLEKNLINSLDIAISLVGRKRRVIFETKGITYNLDIDKILYVTKETVTRQSVIVCDNTTYYINMNLKHVVKKLNDDFIQTHRACFVNKNRIKIIDQKEMFIVFDNMLKIKLISKKYVEGMVTK